MFAFSYKAHIGNWAWSFSKDILQRVFLDLEGIKHASLLIRYQFNIFPSQSRHKNTAFIQIKKNCQISLTL